MFALDEAEVLRVLVLFGGACWLVGVVAGLVAGVNVTRTTTEDDEM